MNWILSYEKKYPWALIGIILALIFFILSYYYPRNTEPDVDFIILNETNVLDLDRNIPDLKVSYEGDDLQLANMNLGIFTIRVENIGNGHVIQGMYDRNNPWGFRVNAVRLIDRPRLIEVSSEYLRNNLNASIEGDSVLLEKVIFEKEAYAILEILAIYSKETIPKVTSFGNIAGVDLEVLRESERRERSLSYQIIKYVFLSIGIVILIMVIVGLLLVVFEVIDNSRKSKIRKKRIAEIFKNRDGLDDMSNILIDIYSREGIKSLNGMKDVLESPDTYLQRSGFFENNKEEFQGMVQLSSRGVEVMSRIDTLLSKLE